MAALVLLAACSRPDPPPERTEPWPAVAVQKATAALVARYRIAPASHLEVSLATREAKLAGRIPGVDGALQLDLLDLRRSQGTLRIDVGALRFDVPDEVGEARQQTSEAQNWLDLGSSQPESARRRKRWAEFVVTRVSASEAVAAHEGKRRPTRRPDIEAPTPPPSSDPPPADAPDARAAETREVRLEVTGDLTFHGYRVEHTAAILLRLHYPEPASPETKPTRVEIQSRRPVLVPLAEYDVKPRDASGTFVAAGMKMLGTKVGRDARVSIRLVASPEP